MTISQNLTTETGHNSLIERPFRVLHVLGGLNHGGVERWLIDITKRIDRRIVQFDFVIHDAKIGACEPEIRDLGSQVFRCIPSADPMSYSFRFLRLLHRYGPYDAVHSHVHLFSGMNMCIAKIAGVPRRISHSHITQASQRPQWSILRRLYAQVALGLIRGFASSGIAVSWEAAADLFGSDWKLDRRWEVFPCAIDLTRYCRAIDRAAVRRMLSIPDSAFVIGHAGRFVPQKNHGFLLEVAESVARRRPDAIFLLAGDGPLRAEIERRAAEIGLTNLRFVGARDDIPALLGAMDLFVFPSLYEGVPLAVIEAQASGLDCIVASHLPPEMELVPQAVRRVPLQAELWTDALCEFRNEPGRRITNRECATRSLASSNFNLDRSMDNLLHHYERHTFHPHAA